MTIQQISNHPDTMARVVFINPELREIKLNIGEIAVHAFKQSVNPDVIRTRRVGNVELVKLKKAEKIYEAPWETIGK